MTSSEPSSLSQNLADLPPLLPFGARGEAPPDRPATIRLSDDLKSVPVVDAAAAHVATVHGLLLDGWLDQGLSFADGTIHVNQSITSADELEQHVVRGLSGRLILETHGGAFGRRL